MEIGNLHLPTLAEWRAFIQGVREFRSSVTTSYPDLDRSEAYDCGREFAHWVTGRRFEE